MAQSFNERIEDQTVAHGIFVHRYTTGVVKRMIALLDATDADIVGTIANADPSTFPGSSRDKRLRTMLDKLRRLNVAAYEAVLKANGSELVDFARYEAEFWRGRLNGLFGADIFGTLPPPEHLRAIVLVNPIAGQPLKDWWKQEERDRHERIAREIRIGMVEGETIDQLIRRIRGSRAAGYADGALQTNRNRAETIVRTAVTHVQAQAAEALYSEHSDIIQKVRWVSTLDGKTTEVCMARDGQVYPLNTGPRPPAHRRCRSRTAPVLASFDSLAKDGSLKAGRGSTNLDRLFRQRLKEKGLSPEAVERAVLNARASMDGQVSAGLNYSGWLRGKPAGFQDEVLGPVKGKLFRDGGVSIDRFVDYSGRSYTLDELRQREPEAFRRAGLDG